MVTINNPLEHGFDHETIKLTMQSIRGDTLYWCMCDEQGDECETLHTHIFIYRNSPFYPHQIDKLFPKKHRDICYGSAEENRAYVLKDGDKFKKQPDGSYDYTDSRGKKHQGINFSDTFFETGQLPDEPGQGYRSDIAEIYQQIYEGYSNSEIMFKNPGAAEYIGKMDRIRQDIIEDRYRNVWRTLSVTYIWGPTGTGKTRGIMEEHGYGNVYRVTDYKHPFDRYASEPCLLLDEFRSSLMVGDMLNYLDGYPISLPARYANRVACYETVYIVSNIDLKRQYPLVQTEESATWKAFLRRIHKVIEYKADGSTIDHGNAMDYIFPPPPPTQDWVEDAENAAEDYDQLPF